MKSFYLVSLLILSSFWSLAQTKYTITGTVLDEKEHPVAFANVYIDGSLDGTSSDEFGKFVLKTSASGTITLMVSYIGYETFSIKAAVSALENLEIKLKSDASMVEEIVVHAGNFILKGTSRLESKSAVDLVTSAGSDGDIYRAISLLPGNQVPAADGRLLVRGGSSRESQTYIDDMHVLSPYTFKTDNIASRGRYSPFLFEGINFSTGGYSSEYSQSLSSVLPLTTKDESPVTKIGVNAMNIGAGGGGTLAWNKGSASFNFNYTDLRLYQEMFPAGEKSKWPKPYRDYSGQQQLRFELGENAYLKTYFGYDKSGIRYWEDAVLKRPGRMTDYNEDNLYMNTTFRKRFASNWNLFAGIAYAWNRKDITGGNVANDHIRIKETEWHLKTKASKRFSAIYKMEMGAETMLRAYDLYYRDQSAVSVDNKHSINGWYVSNDFTVTRNLLLNVSSRIEHTTLDRSTSLLPRIALSYRLGDWVLSAVAGRYQQSADPDYQLYQPKLTPEKNTQTLLGMYYQKNNKIFRIEGYNKSYTKLTRYTDDLDPASYNSYGNGYSRGIDIFLNDREVLPNLEYMVSYSYNDSRRLYEDFPIKARPNYATKHNASLLLKYNFWKWRSTFSMTHRLASGRPYNDPNREGFMNGRTPGYYSMNLSWTFLPHKHVIFYTGLSNVFNRKNVYGYHYATTPGTNGTYERQAIQLNASQNRTFYFGFFITLFGNTAYDASNF